MVRVVGVAVEKATFHFDKYYHYTADSCPLSLCRGCRVLVPFGRGNRACIGVVMEVTALPEADTRRFKAVLDCVDAEPLFSEELLDLAEWLKERTFCTVFEALRAMLPVGLSYRVKPVYSPVRPLPETAVLKDDELAVYRLACTLSEKSGGGVPGDTLLRLSGLQADSTLPEQLCRRGVLTRAEEAVRHSGDATRRMARLAVAPEELPQAMQDKKCSPKQRSVLALLAEVGVASVKEVAYLSGVTNAVLSALEKKQLIVCFDSERLRTPHPAGRTPAPCTVTLSDEQQRVLTELTERYRSPQAACALLYGVTGSGKTQVYMRLIEQVLADGKQTLVMVPEISLTPQVTDLFLSRFGDRVAVLHSGLSVGERMDEWKRIRRGEAAVVVGTRSAVFAPFSRLGLIVMDEEQEHTYKSEQSPRYHAREVAKFRCAHEGALLLLASATPSTESYYAAIEGRYSLHTLTARYGASLLPEVSVVDMREHTGSSLFSEPLLRELRTCLDNGKQAILLLNRRGYHTFVSCRSCGRVVTCPSCSISLTYHRANGKLVCHYCGHVQPVAQRCAECGSDKIRYSGIGTQRVEEELQEHFPEARILRMDTDTTMSRYAYEEKFKAFAAGEYSIMIGTQMVAKGLDFPRVSLVGVLSADQALYGGDYRSYETAFSLLTQVIGRAGRRDTPGKAVIQTTVPDHYVIRQASEQNFPAFFDTEIRVRKMMKYPPFTELYLFGFVGESEERVRAAAGRFLMLIKTTVVKPAYAGLPLIALDPTPATVSRLGGKYRYKLLAKLNHSAKARRLAAELVNAFSAMPENRDVTVFVDRDPVTVL